MKKLIKNIRKNYMILILSVCMAAVLCAVLIVVNKAEKEPRGIENDTKSISIYDLSLNSSDVIILDGVVESKNISTIVTDITAPVSDLYVYVGNVVKKGDVLCRFDTAEIESEIAVLEKEEQSVLEQERVNHERNRRELQNATDDKDRQLARANNNISSVQSEIDEVKSKIEHTKIKYQEVLSQSAEASDADDEADIEADVNNGLVYIEETSAEDYANEIKELDNELDSLEEELSEYKNTYTDIEIECDRIIQDCIDTINEEVSETGQNSDELARLKAQIDKSVIIAPQDGIVTEVNVSVGASVSEECIVKIADMNSIIVKIQIPEENIFKVYEGMLALVSIPVDGGKTVRGSVWKIIKVPVSDEETAQNFYDAYIDVSNTDINWIYNMNTEVALTSSDRIYMYNIPDEYIFEDENGEYVFTVKERSDGDFAVTKQYIVKGNEYSDKNTTEISFDGINRTTKIIKSDSADMEIYDGELLSGEYFSDDIIMNGEDENFLQEYNGV